MFYKAYAVNGSGQMRVTRKTARNAEGGTGQMKVNRTKPRNK